MVRQHAMSFHLEKVAPCSAMRITTLPGQINSALGPCCVFLMEFGFHLGSFLIVLVSVYLTGFLNSLSTNRDIFMSSLFYCIEKVASPQCTYMIVVVYIYNSYCVRSC